MSRKRLAIYATGASFILATSAMAQSNDRVNSALAVGALLGGAVQKANEANARKQWSALSADNLFCVRQSIGRNNLELEKLAAAGIGPADKRMKPLVDECSSLTSQVLQTGLSCKITRSDGSAFSSVCDQAYVLEQNGSATKLSLQQYLELAFKGQNVSVKAVERDDARVDRLAKEEAARGVTQQSALGGAQTSGQQVSRGGASAPSANWKKLDVRGPPQFFDASNIKSGSNWRNYDSLTSNRQTSDVNGNTVTYGSWVTNISIMCPFTRNSYNIHSRTVYYSGPNGDGDIIARDDKVSAYHPNDIWEREVSTICSYPISQSGFKINPAQEAALTKARSVQAKNQAEEDSKPRGFYMMCAGGAVDDRVNIIAVNCRSADEISSKVRASWLLLRAQAPQFADACFQQLPIMTAAIKRGQSSVVPAMAPGAFAACNLGLSFLKGPSKTQQMKSRPR
jgi:hypothetical protein